MTPLSSAAPQVRRCWRPGPTPEQVGVHRADRARLPARPSAPRGAGCWPCSTSTPNWPRSPRPPPSWSAPPTNSPRRCTRDGMAARLPHCTGLTELPGLGHMTPIEDTGRRSSAVIRALVADHLTSADQRSDGTTIRTEPDVAEGGEKRMSGSSIDGQVVVVTGAARGVGALLARKLAARGARVALVGLEPDELKNVAASLGGSAAWWTADVTDREAMAAGRRRGAGALRPDRHRGRQRRCGDRRVRSSTPTPTPSTGSSTSTCSAASPPPGRSCRRVVESRGYFLQIASLAAMTPGADDGRVLREQVGCGGVRAQPARRGRPQGRQGGRRLPELDRHRHGARRRRGRRRCASCGPGCPGRPTAPIRWSRPSTGSSPGSYDDHPHVYGQWWLRGMQPVRGYLPSSIGGALGEPRDAAGGSRAGAQCGGAAGPGRAGRGRRRVGAIVRSSHSVAVVTR